MNSISIGFSRRFITNHEPSKLIPMILHRCVTIDVFKGRRKKMARPKSKKVVKKLESPLISQEEIKACTDDPVFIKTDGHLTNSPNHKITAESVDQVIKKLIEQYLPGNSTKNGENWTEIPLKPLGVKFLISINATRECMTPLSSWDLTKVQTAGQLSKAILNRYHVLEDRKLDIDSVERYFADNVTPRNLYFLYPKRSSSLSSSSLKLS